MPFQINTHNFTIPDELKKHIEETIGRVLKGVTPIDPQVEITQNTHHRKGEIYSIVAHIPLPHKLIRAEIKDVPDIRSGMRTLKDKLEKQIEKYKNK